MYINRIAACHCKRLSECSILWKQYTIIWVLKGLHGVDKYVTGCLNMKASMRMPKCSQCMVITRWIRYHLCYSGFVLLLPTPWYHYLSWRSPLVLPAALPCAAGKLLQDEKHKWAMKLQTNLGESNAGAPARWYTYLRCSPAPSWLPVHAALQLVEQLQPGVSLYGLEQLQKSRRPVHVPETAPSGQESNTQKRNTNQ